MMHPAAGVVRDTGQENSFSSEHYKALRRHFAKPSVEHSVVTSSQHVTASISDRLRTILFDLVPTMTQQITPSTSLRQLGLDSIGVIQLVARLKESNISVTAADILEQPTIANLERLLQAHPPAMPLLKFQFGDFRQTHLPNICNEFGIEDDEIDIRPCTPIQMGLLSQFYDSKGCYVNAVTYKLDNKFSSSDIYEALRATVYAHPMLRTGFVPVNDPVFNFAMVTYSPTVFDISLVVEFIDCPDSLEKLRTATAADFERHPQQPWWRTFVSETKQGILIQLIIFHGLYDRQSLDITLSDLQKALPPSRSPTPTAVIENVLGDILYFSLTENVDLAKTKQSDAAPFWKRHLYEAPSTRFPCLTPLNSNTRRTMQMTNRSSLSRHSLEKACRRADITFLAAAQTVWASLLARYTGQPIVIFGTVFSGRDISVEAGTTAFPTIVTVPTPVQVQSDQMDIIKSLMRFNASVRRHQFTPLNVIQRWIGRPGETLFDTLFVLHTGVPSKCTFEIVEEISIAEYAVSLELDYAPDGHLLIQSTFNVDVLPPEQAKIMLKQYDAALRFVFGSEPIEDSLFSFSPPKENTIPSPVGCLHEFVERKAQENPKQVALEFAYDIDPSGHRTTITYQRLNDSGNQIANFLVRRGVRQGAIVGVCFDKCPEASLAMLGILKAGCAFLAIDPSIPAYRKAFILMDSEAALVFTAGGAFYGLGADKEDHSKFGSTPIISVDNLDWDSLSVTKPALSLPVAPADICYCLYTSGTSGAPKGCLISHRNAVQAMRAFSRLFAGHWDSASRFLQFASYHFDVSVLEQYWSWSENVRVVSAPRDVILQDLPAAIKALGITHIDLTPSLAVLLRPEDVPTLCQGVFITGGEKLKQEIIDVWGPKGVIYNGYGPTEATIGVTMYPRVPANGRPSNIGYPFDNVGVAVLHLDSEEFALRGAVGELCVSGMLVSAGYLKRPELSAQKFFLNTYFDPPIRFYRTGDLVRLLHDGSIDYIGRVDEQVKLRGQRLEAGEVNNVICMACPTVTEITSLVLKRAAQQKDQLVVFLSSHRAGARPQLMDVVFSADMQHVCRRAAQACRSKLPGYMVPTHFIPVSHLPLTSNNKVDRRALQQIYDRLTSSELRTLSSAPPPTPLTGQQHVVAEALSKVATVQIDDIHSESNLFELGLDSISLHRFSRELKQCGFRNAKPSMIAKCKEEITKIRTKCC